MRGNNLSWFGAPLLLAALAAHAAGQDIRVEAGRRATAVPKVCEALKPASVEGEIDAEALAREAACRGAGDAHAEYTYVLKSSMRSKDKKGQVKEETATYEVYIPALKSGLSAPGVLLVTSRNGVPVPPDKLEKERLRAGERLEKQESRLGAATSSEADHGPEAGPEVAAGMLPLGTYPRMKVQRGARVINRAEASLAVQSFLEKCRLTLLRRERVGGREALVFAFAPNPQAQFYSEEKYLALIRGVIWIDAEDRIVTRLAGWPAGAEGVGLASLQARPDAPAPAVLVEMMRLPDGIWLPSVIRLNGADYPTLFGGIKDDTTLTYADYKRFATETKEVHLEIQLNPPEGARP
ncbi:MAG TPA: hypothetical protein VEY09_04280 [Pyrinomonadaceae bacterium]|nr:hypothetical protein [Pyrinomonadaceae bacterium]